MAAGGQSRYASAIGLVGEVPVMAGPGDEVAAGAVGRMRASHADRDRVIDVLKAYSNTAAATGTNAAPAFSGP